MRKTKKKISSTKLTKLAVVVTVRQGWLRPDCLFRLFLVLKQLQYINVGKIIVVDSSNLAAHCLIMLTCFMKKNVTLSRLFIKVHTPGVVKNFGAKLALKEQKITHILFLDVDVLLSAGAVTRLEKAIEINEQFHWFPVQFLEVGNGLIAMRKACKNFPDQNLKPSSVYQTGYVTGIQMFSRSCWVGLNGYSEEFFGYGCEDIEMLHRATALYKNRPIFDEFSSYYEDHRTATLRDYKGFRRYYFNCKWNTPISHMPIHFYHPRKTSSTYLKLRNNNDIVLNSTMKLFDKNR